MLVETIEELVPPIAEIPAQFKDWSHRSLWNKIYNYWFYKGLPHDTVFLPKEGINIGEAREHIKKIMGDFTHTTEEKEAGASYLLSQWFEDIIIPGMDI